MVCVAGPRYHVYLQGRSRRTRERPFNARVPGNQPNFLLIDLYTDLADELAQNGAPPCRIGLVEGFGASRGDDPRCAPALGHVQRKAVAASAAGAALRAGAITRR